MHITIHLGLIAAAVLGAFVFGLIIRAVQVSSLRRQVLELEKEKMQDHAEILQLQRKLADQQLRINSTAATPVVPLIDKDSNKPDEGKGIRATQ